MFVDGKIESTFAIGQINQGSFEPDFGAHNGVVGVSDYDFAADVGSNWEAGSKGNKKIEII